MRLARYTAPLYDLDTMIVYDDFTLDSSSTFWTDTLTDAGTITVGDVRNGIASLTPSDGSVADNDEAYRSTPNALFLHVANKPMYGRAFIQYAEGDVTHANVMFGFMSTPGQNMIVDDGGGPKASGSCSVIYKVDGGTVWRAQSRNGSEYTDSISVTTAGGSAYQLLEVIVEHYTTTKFRATYKVDGQFLKDSNGVVIRHTISYLSAVQMVGWIGMKNGETTTVETLLIDMLYFHQLR